MEHTKEPWITKANEVDEHCFEVMSDGWYVATTHDGCDGEQNAEANARRIVACVNACAGISTENLEQNRPLIYLARQYNVALRQRDELLAALQKAASTADAGRLSYDDNELRNLLERIRDEADAAIARAEGK